MKGCAAKGATFPKAPASKKGFAPSSVKDKKFPQKGPKQPGLPSKLW